MGEHTLCLRISNRRGRLPDLWQDKRLLLSSHTKSHVMLRGWCSIIIMLYLEMVSIVHE